MLKRMTNVFVRFSDQYMPDAFIFALLLTIIMFVVSWLFVGVQPLDLVYSWGDGFWSLLSFAMQMSLVVVFGETFASAPIIKRLIQKLASVPKSKSQAIIYVTVISTLAMFVQWGFGLVFGAILSKEVAKKVRDVDFRLLLAASYSTFIMHLPSNSIFLKVASDTAEELSATSLGAITAPIPLTETLLSPLTITILALLFILQPIFFARLHPDPEDTVSLTDEQVARMIEEDRLAEEVSIMALERGTPAAKLENAYVLNLVPAVMIIIYLYRHFIIDGQSLGINTMNLIFLGLSLIFHPSPRSFIAAVDQAASSASGIMLQFPFYGGISGMLVAQNAVGVSLASWISSALVDFSSPITLPLMVFIIAAILNMFVPSSGGLWVIQAPMMFPAAVELGVDLGLIVIALVFGEMWTNTIQPFWALPALSIANLEIKDIMGFCTSALFLQGVICIGCILLWSIFGF